MCDKDVKQLPDNHLKTSGVSLTQGPHSSEETLGDIVIALLSAGQIISRRTLCLKLISRIETATDPTSEAHLNNLLQLILRNNRS